ncbi:MAG TPA: 6-phosphofructokinase [Bacilli bacterium]|nr:6-phosphofructokinase [Bacilli bacterium]
MVKKVALLTSGGDAPGMNAAIRAIVRAGLINNLEMYAVFEGFKGLVEDMIKPVDRSFVSEILMRGGTILKTARLKSFNEDEVQNIAVENLKKHGIDALVIIGGDGSYRGGSVLAKKGINVIGIPATIDNDVVGTDTTIGFDTALNTITEAVDKLRDTSSSHLRCSIIEVMGNRCGDLALYGGTACGVDLILSPEYRPTDEEIIQKLQDIHHSRSRHALVLVSEKLFPNIQDFGVLVREKTGFDTTVEILGRIQRGGSPTAADRVLAARFGVHAIEVIVKGKKNRVIGITNGEVKDYDIDRAERRSYIKTEELIGVISTLK